MQNDNVTDMKNKILALIEVCQRDHNCDGCPADIQNGDYAACFFVVGGLPPWRWMERLKQEEEWS